MPARLLCQSFFQDALAPLHLYRQKALTDAVSAVINGASLSLTSIGRHLPGQACVKHKIKRIDRLLGNTHLHDEVSVVFTQITRRLVKNMSRVFILVDWTSYPSESFQLLRASLACDGRSLPLMSIVVPKAQQASSVVHKRLLDSLAHCFSQGTEVTIIADAGFHGLWFHQVSSRGWTYICRVRGNHYYRTGTEWKKVMDAGEKATNKPRYLGEGLLGKNSHARHKGHFYLYKEKAKGRKNHRPKYVRPRGSLEKQGRGFAKAPWLIFTNTTQYTARQIMKIYSRRMQIEQNFRDEKNSRYGFGLKEGMSHSAGRLSVLSLIATLASIIMWLCGYHYENKGLHRRYQANTIKHRRVLSLLKLAENILRHSPRLFARTPLAKSLEQLSQRYIEMILVY